jgi:VWFA-related protein
MRPIAISLLLLPALASLAQPQLESRDADSFHLSASVNLVVAQPTVRDREGRFASDLHEADFQVFENGARQSIKLFRHEDVPVTVGLVIDHSGSMRSKLTDVITAARIFVQSSRRDDQIFVVNFNENVTLGLPPGVRFSDDPDELARAISNTAPAGRTALYDAAAEGFKRLRSVGPEKKVLIIISDGGDNASMEKLAGILKTAEQSSDLVHHRHMERRRSRQ